MRSFNPFRSLIAWATLLGLLGGVGSVACAQRGRRAAPPAQVVRQGPAYRGAVRQQRPAPIERSAPGGGAPVQRTAPYVSAPAVREEPHAPLTGPPQVNSAGPKGHLGEWMNQHSNLAPSQQQQALEREPGFRQLPPQQQQNMRNRLAQLNAMSPQQRQRMLAHNEAMERLTPDQRGQVRGAMQQLGSLPPDQRQSVARSFRELRELPAGQRSAALNSGRYNNLNPTQRATLNNLMRVEPMLPPPERQQP